MAVVIEKLALRIVRALHKVTEGRPQQWRAAGSITKDPEAQQAIQYAVDEGWLLVEGGHSLCLTGVGRRLVD